MQNRFKGCLFQCSNIQRFSKISNVLMGKKLELVACLCFGLGPAPKTFTKLLKFPMSVLRGLMIWVIIFFEDLLIVRDYHGGNTHGTRLCDFSSAALTHYNKLQKFHLGTNSGHRVSGYGYKFKNDGTLFNSKKGAKNEESLFESVYSTNHNSARFDETVRKVKFHY